jgi:hypothetical protein
MTLTEALHSRHAAQRHFEQALKNKIESIKFAYSKDNLNAKQLEFLKRDESFCKASEEFANKLIHQITFLIKENKEQQLFMQTLMQDVDKWQEQYINICLELNQKRFDEQRAKGEMKFNFQQGLQS